MTHRFRFTCTRLLPACALAALLVGPPGFAPSANAADVTYPGSNLDKGPLWNIDNSLFPAGSLSDNVVTINSGNVGGDVYGNDVDAAFSPVSNNTVILSGGSVGGDILGGANNGAVTDNNVSISGFGSVLGSVYGGYGAAEGTVNGNDVSIFDSGSVTGNVLGGYSRSVNSHVIGNTVTISGGTVRDIYGGQSGKGNALNNRVTLDGAASQTNVIYGGRVEQGTARENAVVMKNGSVTLGIFGGIATADGGQAQDNHVTMSGGAVGEHLIGGYVQNGSGAATGNSVIFNGGSVTENVYGGRSVNGPAQNNSVTMTNGSANWLLGGYSDSGDVSGNSVNVSGGTLSGGVNGGETTSGNATGNSVDFSNVTATYVQGGYSGSGSATGNSLAIRSGTVQNNAFGGYVDSGSGEASGNSVTFNGGSVANNIYGGMSAAGLVQSNSVIMTNGSAKWLLGGYSNSGDVSGNSVNVSGGTLTGVSGGESNSGSATGNIVSISGGTVQSNVNGGFVASGSGKATGNIVNISGNADLSTATVAGGISSSDAFTGNTLNKNSDAAVHIARNFASVNFGYSGNANIGELDSTPTGSALSGVTVNTNANNVSFDGVISGSGSITKTGAGTLILSGTNTYSGGTTISAGTLSIGSDTNIGSGTNTIGNKGTLLLSGNGTYTNDWTLSGAGSAIATDNNNTLSGVLSGNGGLTKTGAGTLTLTGNNTYAGGTAINDGTLKGNIASGTDLSIAASAIYDGDNKARSVGGLNGGGKILNTDGLTVQSGDFAGIIDNSNTSLLKNGAGTLTLTGNNAYTGSTTISEGTLKGNIASGTDLSIAASAIYDGDNKARSVGGLNGGGKILNTSGLTVQSGTFGGVIDNSNTSLIKTGAGTLTLSGTNTYTGMTTVRSGTLALGSDLTSNQLTLYGGTVFDRGSHNHSLDNGILSVNGANSQSAMYKGDLSARNATLNFISPVHPTQPLLRVTGDADVSGSAYNVGLAGGTSLASGSTLTLLEVDPDKTLTANNLQRGNGIVQIGSTVAHDITADVNLDPTTGRLNAVTAQVSPGRATDQSKALPECFLGGLALNLQGADLVAGRGMDSAVRASSGTDDAERHGFAGFGALSGGSLRYNTGSHLDMNSLSLLTGLAWGIDLAPGRLTLGAFFEYGNGSYDTHNSFTNAASVDGDGNAYYLGGGILARMDFVNTGPGRFYAEASGRAGKTHNEYDSSDLRDAAGRKADYDSSSPYYGLHFGTGYVWNINDAATLDLYGKYFWTRQQGDSVGLSTGEHLSFDDINSSRLRFGGRFAYILNEHVAPYIGAAWEHEFDGKARAKTNGFDIDAPNLRGNTGIGELGLSLTPSADLPLTIDLGVQGYTGKHEGVTGSLMVKWEF
ncbi:autotransporter-associated beta strand repeat-containing protein [uncultured Bilophila sp.]|uniref:beta strand repeat-containing protein n=1 Tax=uncultured Bilophila sp. TaxID=529385 RepID=UPI002597D116|nr:autotransporter-associated beta strand repeat-containing protein [uncultured Bilophila sp.]